MVANRNPMFMVMKATNFCNVSIIKFNIKQKFSSLIDFYTLHWLSQAGSYAFECCFFKRPYLNMFQITV